MAVATSKQTQPTLRLANGRFTRQKATAGSSVGGEGGRGHSTVGQCEEPHLRTLACQKPEEVTSRVSSVPSHGGPRPRRQH
ncbi:unnamed protein product [Rhizoctonia solani]|uniref:Uncharacterized protein n=1 Tax=Rhizoctonia solani TaxID=456999 RepID=A0A8H3E9Z1_9AGAM|nr:unnamed protein product [Rhizoctonia solani]